MSKQITKGSILAVLSIVLLLLSFGASVVASSTIQGVVVGQVPVIATQGPVTLASIRFAESGASSIQTGDTIEVTLSSGMEFQTGLLADQYYEATSNITVAHSFSENNRKITYTFTRPSLLTEAAFLAKLPVVVIGSIPTSGNATVSVSSNNINIIGGNFITGGYGPLAVGITVTPGTIPVLSQYGANPQTIARTISFAENGPGALKSGSENKVVVSLPKGLFWASSTYAVQTYPALPAGVTVTAVREAGSDQLSLILNGGTTTSATTFSIVNPNVNLNYLASEGDVKVQVAGTGYNDRINTSFVLAKIIGWGVSTRRQANVNPFEVIAGRQSQAMANIEIIEATMASLSPGGTITVTLPKGLQFAVPPSATYNGVVGTQPQIQLNTGNRTIVMNITAASTSAGSVVVNLNASGNILVSPGYNGSVDISVGGTAGASGLVTVANVVSPVTIKALDVLEIPTNASGLIGGEIVIQEVAAGRIAPGVIVLQLPDGIIFSSTPSIDLGEGNITFGLGTLSNNGSTLTVPINSRSTQASKIVIGNINYRIASWWWDAKNNKIEVTLEGNSLMDTAVTAAFTDSADKLKVVNAESGAVKVSVFTIGSKAYTLGRESMPMDQEPVIVNDRTMLPLRFVGEAIGLREDEIHWDPVKRTVTLFRGDRVAQVTIGSKIILINGAPVEMDVVPQIMNGRTMLPIRWIGLALRVNVEWDAVKRTVTVTP
ncbi:MAG: copper amine oxidase N-terminal domain-containing protein [Clostridiales bacterium]|nr:copper amine oxidase N-terminal domain-containing protein [Clostridiales bacterium]